jgi:hypothetical protein
MAVTGCTGVSISLEQPECLLRPRFAGALSMLFHLMGWANLVTVTGWSVRSSSHPARAGSLLVGRQAYPSRRGVL